MIKRRTATRLAAAFTLTAYVTTTLTAFAHNNQTHQNIVNHAWQVMRTTSRSDLVGHIQWATSTPPASAPDLTQPGDCSLPASDPKNLCGQTVSSAEWTTYLMDVQRARHELSGISTELPGSSSDTNCSGYSPNQRLGAFSRPVSPQHMADSEAAEKQRRFSCDFAGGAAAHGLFADFEAPDDGAGNQGLILGWHAQHRDQDQADTEIDVTLPVVGQLLEIVTAIYELALAAVFIPFVCLWSFFVSGENCVDVSQRLADDLDPVDYLKGLLPGWRAKETSELGKTLWHFINVQDGLANEYDDNQGMYYEEAGPGGWVSGVDHALVLYGDLAFLTLDASNSAGTERYEITSDETEFSHPSSNRGEVRWQMEAFPHTAFSPLDNFAYYGDMGRPDGHPGVADRGLPFQMGWPLHAIGDACVPYHVTGTTGWGHRPYEDAVEVDWRLHVFEDCRAGDPCDSTLATPDPDFLKLSELQQAHRILQRGFRWLTYLRAHPDTRDLITQLARDTLAASMDVPPAIGLASIWCDSCSSGYVAKHRSALEATFVSYYTFEWDKDGVADPVGYYQGLVPFFQTASGKQYFTDKLFNPTRLLVEQAIGATVGYLTHRGQASNCTGLGDRCQRGLQCCSGECGASATGTRCCRSGAEVCASDSECCSGSCVNEVCSSHLGESCRAASCSDGQCVDGVCCHPGTQACTRNSDCCSGDCHQGQCVASDCTVTGCASGQTCGTGRCCTNSGQSCSATAACCSGSCGPNGKCRSNVTEACTTDETCATNLCVEGKCCSANAATCQSNSECCSGTCKNGSCKGKAFGEACTDFSQCASRQCVAGACTEIVK